MLKKLLHKKNKLQAGHCSAVIVAAGTASRMKGEDKILSELDGKSVMEHSIEAFMNSTMIDEIVIVTRADLLGHLRSLCAAKGYHKVTSIVEGGETRVHSVMNGLDHVSKKTGLTAIHDGARPLITTEIIDETVSKARSFGAAAPAVPVKDTIKAAKNHIVLNTPDRSTLFAIQTPQVFDYDLLRGALKKALDEQTPITDDCSAVEAMGMSVYLSKGSEENIKITTPIDLILAEAILKRRNEQ